jgi:TRAP transporter TAXI family solute receptor
MGAFKNRVALVLCLLLAAGLARIPELEAGEARLDTLRLATGSVGGTFLPVGHDLVSWWAETLDGIVVLPETTAGSVDNLDRLISGEADIAIVGSSPFREILNGWGTLSDEAESICTLGTLYRDAEQFVARASLVRAGNLLDLNGLVMYPGPYQSGGEIDTRRILNLLGIEPRYVYVDDRDKGYAAAAQALSRGDFDAATFSGGVPIQAITDLFREHPGEFRILPFSRHMLSKLQYYGEDYETVIIREGSYPGLAEDIQAAGGPNLLVAAPAVNARLLSALDWAVREGIQEAGEGLRVESSHPVLQVLDPILWSEVPVGTRCVEPAVAELGTPDRP